MCVRKSKATELDEIALQAVVAYFANHTAASTIRKFNLSRVSFDKICDKLSLVAHTKSDAELFKHLEQDGYDNYSDQQKFDIVDYYKTHSMTCTCEKFDVKEYFVRLLLNEFKVTLHSIQEEIDLTRNQKYGFAFSKTKEEKEQIEIEKYGQLDLSKKEKVAITNKKLYGVENVFANKDIIEKLEQTKLNKYGDKHFTNRQKAAKTCIERFGSESYLGSIKAKENNVFNKSAEARKNSFLEALNDDQHELFLQCYNDRNLLIKVIQDLPHNTTSHLAEKLNISRNLAYSLVDRLNVLDYIDLKTSNTSHYEDELIKFIGEDLCIKNDKQVLSPYEIDIYIPSKNIGIEFNGDFWHSSICKEKNYHFNKSKLAEKRGIRLIHIYEYEWVDVIQRKKIELMLNIALGRNNTKIYARQCEVRKITNAEATLLNEQIHLQGHRNAQVTYGLFYKNELVQLMSFSKTKYNRNLTDNNSWEIIRGCPSSNNIVVGGVSKLFKHFVKEYHPTKVFSYCDFNKFNGKSYEALGMKFIGYTGPDMKWLLQNGMVVNRSPSKHAEYKSKAKAQIFGAGSKKYLLDLTEEIV